MDMLKGKVAVVTGGTRGIGYSIVETFLRNGATVVLLGSRQETVDKALASLKEADPAWPVEGFAPKLDDYNAMQELFAKLHEKYGRIDILVNNAGVSARESLYTYDPTDFDRVMDLNVNSVFYACRAVAPIMKAQGGGVILNTSSMVSLYGQAAGAAYPTSKWAINGLTKSLARELGPDGIRVNAVAPGVTRTDMVAALPKEMVDRISAPIPLRRMGEPEEVANAFLFLASDMASYITGAVLSVDGAAMS